MRRFGCDAIPLGYAFLLMFFLRYFSSMRGFCGMRCGSGSGMLCFLVCVEDILCISMRPKLKVCVEYLVCLGAYGHVHGKIKAPGLRLFRKQSDLLR